MAGMTKVSPISAGLQGRCPTCGQGRVWRGYLKFKPACEACGQDFTQADTADGPAFFVGFFVLIILAPFGFIIPMADQPIWWKILLMVILAIITIVVSLILLPIAKSLLMALQIANKAEQARFED
tara:strand:+ start:61 stop:435 length:375 start_codon:yes stop_codon:yes gene_type:complete